MQSSDRPHQNDNFDLLRLIAALMVLWSHQHVLLGFPEPVVSAIEGSLGTLGVCIFFGISGYLNALSLLRRRSAGSFLIGRALRIYPALIACIAFCVILGAFVTTDSANYYGLKTLKFFVQNSTLLGTEVRLPGVFKSNIYPEAVNGSIWTLPIEVTLYIGFALLALITKFKIRMTPFGVGDRRFGVVGLLTPCARHKYRLCSHA